LSEPGATGTGASIERKFPRRQNNRYIGTVCVKAARKWSARTG